MAKWGWWYLFLKGAVFTYPVGYVFLKFFKVVRVHGCSMQPCLNPQVGISDYVHARDVELWKSDISRGDVVTLTDPRDPNEVLIKRVIGLEGDVIVKTRSSELVTVPKGHCWVEGDHTRFSKDSNMFGPVSLGLIESEVRYIVWPPSRWQRIPRDIPVGREPFSQLS